MTCDDHVTRGPFATAWRHGERSICCEFPAWKNFVSFRQHPSTALWKYMEIHVAKDTFMMTLTHWLRLGNVGNPTPGGIMQPPDIPDIIGLGCDRTPIESAAQKCSKSKRRATFRIFGNEHLHESFWRWDEEFSLRFSPSDPPCLGWSGTRTIGQRFVSWPFYSTTHYTPWLFTLDRTPFGLTVRVTPSRSFKSNLTKI